MLPPGSLVAAYLRDSGGDEQEQSLDSQERAIRSWCDLNHLTLSKVFRDTRSGTSTAGRDGFLAMMDHFTRRDPPPERGVILWSFSRFAREINDSQYYKAELRRRGFFIHSMSDTIPEGLDGRLLESVLEWKDAKFSADLSTHVKRGLSDLVQLHGGMPGTPPRGFRREPVEIGTHRDGRARIIHRWVPDEDTWDLCRRAWQMRIGGSSYRKIMDAIPGLYRTVSCYRDFFSNPIYKGELHYGGLVIPGYVEAMVSAADWEAVQGMFCNSIRHGRRGVISNHPRRVGSNYALSGLAFCGRCGAPLGGGSTRSANRKTAVSYYSCSGKRNRRDCRAPNIPQEVLETAVITEFKRQVLTVRNIEQIQSGLDETPPRKELQDLKRELGKRKAVVARLVNAIAYHGYSEALSEKLRTAESEISELDIRISQTEKRIASQRRLSREEIREMVSAALERLKTNDPAELRRVLSMFVKRIDVERMEKKITGTIFFVIPLGLSAYEECPQGAAQYTQTFNLPLKQRHHSFTR